MNDHNEKRVSGISELENLKNASEEDFLHQATTTRMKYRGKWRYFLIIFGIIFIILFLPRLIASSIKIITSVWLLISLVVLAFSAMIFHNYKSNKKETGTNMGGIGIDFSSMNLEELSNQVSYYLNKGEPITLWGMGRENEKLILKAEKVLILQKLFEYLKSMGESLAEYKASVFLHSEYIQDYINNYRINKQRQSEIDEQLHLNRMLELKNAEREMQLDYSSRELEINRQQAEIDRIKAETDIMRIKAQAEASYKEAKTIGQIEVASLIREFVAKVDLSTINPSMKAYLMKVLFHPGNDDYVDMEMNEMMKEMMRKTKDAEIDKKNAETQYKINEAKIKAAEAKSMNYKAQGDKLNLDREKNKYRNN